MCVLRNSARKRAAFSRWDVAQNGPATAEKHQVSTKRGEIKASFAGLPFQTVQKTAF